MTARAIWKAVLRFGKESVPVKLYAAVEDRRVHFRLLHEKDRTPVEQRMVLPSTGREVPFEEIRRGYEVRRGVFVVLSEEELEEARPAPSRTRSARASPAGPCGTRLTWARSAPSRPGDARPRSRGRPAKRPPPGGA